MPEEAKIAGVDSALKRSLKLIYDSDCTETKGFFIIMKKNLQFIFTLALTIIFASSSQAATLYWNGGTNGSGTWDTTTMIWSSTSGGALDSIWNNSVINDASFDATAKAQTITIASADTISVQNISCAANIGAAYTISGGTLNLVGSSVINCGNGGSVWYGIYIKSAITGTNGFTKIGSGYLDLGSSTAVSTYSGTTDIQGGAVNPQSNYAFGNSTVRVRSGGTVWTWAARTLANDFIVDAGGLVTFNGGSGGSRIDGNVTIAGTVANISGGTLTLGGTTLYNSAKTLTIQNGGLLTGSGNITVNSLINLVSSGAIYVGNTWAQSLTVNNSIVGSGATLAMSLTGNASRNHLVTGSIDLGADGVLTKNLTGILTIGGTSDSRASSWGTLKITEGTVQIGNGAGAPVLSSAAQSSNIIISYTGYSGSNYNGRLQFNSAGSYNLSGSISGTSADTFSNFAGGIYLASTNAGTVTLSGSNSYNGQTNVAGGALKITNSAALGSSSLMLSSGGTGTANAQLAGGVSLANQVVLAGRSSSAAHLINLSGTNAVSGNVSLITGGSYYAVESQSGTLTLGNVTNSTASTSDRYFVMTGAGDGVVAGVIGNDATTTGAVNVVKNGAGTWTFSGVNTYAGTTAINAGSLAVAAAGSIAKSAVIAPAAGAIFDVSSVSGFTLGASAAQSLQGAGVVKGDLSLGSFGSVNAAGVGSTGTLSFYNGLDATNGVLYFDLSSSPTGANDFLSVNGTMALGSSSVINVNLLNGYLNSGTYTLAKYSALNGLGGLTAPIGLGNSTSRQVFMLTAGSTALTLNVVGTPMALSWRGTTSSAWDVKTTTNWLSTTADKFYDLDFVLFDDLAASAAVTLNTTVTPAGTIAFNNSTKDYSLSGMGRIVGSASLAKSGTGKLTISNTGTNSFSGNVVINAGSLELSEGATLGTGASLVDNGTFILNNTTNLIWGSSTNLYTNKTISGSGALVKSGSGTLTISNANSFTGNVSINAGKMTLGNSNAVGNLTRYGTISIASGAALDFNSNYVSTLGNMVVSFAGSGADGKGAITNSGTIDVYAAVVFSEMTGDAAVGGGPARFDFGRTTGAYLHGNGYTLTKTGTNRILLVNLGETNLGGLVVNGGDLCVQGSTIIGTSGSLANVTVNTGGLLSYWGSGMAVNNNVTLNAGGSIGASLTDASAGAFGGTITFAGSGNIAVTGASVATFTGAVNGTDVYKTGSGTAVIAGAANWTGVTSIGSGTLKFGNGGALIYNLVGDVANETSNAIVFNASNALSLSNNFVLGKSGMSYGMTFAGSGVYTVTGSNSYLGVAAVTDNATMKLVDSNGYSNAMYGAGGLTITGGTNSAKLALATTETGQQTLFIGLNGDNAITLGGRQPTAINAHILNQSGDNLIVSTINLTTGGDRYMIQSDAGTLAVTNIANMNSTAMRYVYLQGSGFGNVLGEISDSALSATSVIKAGSGTWAVTGYNSYAGSTSVNAGTLVVNGGIAGQVLVGSDAKLVGSGSIGGLTVASGGSVSAGDGVGTLTVDGFAALGGNLIAEISGNKNYDQLVVNGTVTLGGTLTTVVASDFAAKNADLLWIIRNDGADALGGTFSNYAQGDTVFSVGSIQYKIRYGADYATGSLTGGNDVALSAVPEPGTLALLVVAGLAAWAIRPRRE